MFTNKLNALFIKYALFILNEQGIGISLSKVDISNELVYPHLRKILREKKILICKESNKILR